jgi:hypothetical protein
MRAGNRFRFALRSRWRVIGACGVLVLAGLVPASSAAGAQTRVYIAAGDAITFDFSDAKFGANFPNEAPALFDEGFDQLFAKKLEKSTELGKTVLDLNTSCPDEISNGFIGENEALGGQKSTEPANVEGDYRGPGDWHPCPYKNVEGFPLHYSWGEHSQLEEILSILNEGKAAHEVRAISISIGGGDELATLATCEREVKEEPQINEVACIFETMKKVTIPHLVHNLNTALSDIDSASPGGGHYEHAIVLLGYYNPEVVVVPGSSMLITLINEAIEHEVVSHFSNVTYANPFHTFDGAKTLEKQGKTICKLTEMCNPAVQVEGGSPPGEDGDALPSVKGQKAIGKLVNEAWLSNPAK